MNTEKYIVRLSDEERQKLETIVKKLKGTSQKVKRAIVLLKADVDGPNWTNEQIHELTGVSIQTIVNVRKQLVLEGFDVALDRKQRRLPPVPKKLDGLQEAKIIATRCSTPPDALLLKIRWAMVTPTPRRTSRRFGNRRHHLSGNGTENTKKNGLTTRKLQYWVTPPEADEEFVACMEEVLEVYHRPPNPRNPVVAMDEQPVQLLKHVRPVIPAIPARNGHAGHPERPDYEYERKGTACALKMLRDVCGSFFPSHFIWGVRCRFGSIAPSKTGRRRSSK